MGALKEWRRDGEGKGGEGERWEFDGIFIYDSINIHHLALLRLQLTGKGIDAFTHSSKSCWNGWS